MFYIKSYLVFSQKTSNGFPRNIQHGNKWTFSYKTFNAAYSTKQSIKKYTRNHKWASTASYGRHTHETIQWCWHLLRVITHIVLNSCTLIDDKNIPYILWHFRLEQWISDNFIYCHFQDFYMCKVSFIEKSRLFGIVIIWSCEREESRWYSQGRQ